MHAAKKVPVWLWVVMGVVAALVAIDQLGVIDRLAAPGIPLLDQVVHRAEYDRIEPGQSLMVVETIIGHPGEELSRTDLAGAPTTVVYQWINADGSNMNAMFQNDRLVQKAQFGLK